MFDINRKQYIFRLSSGKTVNIYHKESAGICLSTLNKKGTWQAPAIIVKNAAPGFGAYLDKNDVIHILHQDYNGALTYTYCCNSAWNSVPVAVGRNSALKIRDIAITGFDTYIYAFYTIEFPDNNYLYYQIGTIKGNLLEPHAMDIIPDSRIISCFFPAVDSLGNPSVFYLQRNNQATVPGFRTYDPESGQWSCFMEYPGTEADKKLNIVSCCFDEHDNMHLLFSREVASGNELVHTARPGNQLFWQPETCLATSQLPFNNAAFIWQPGILAAYWIEHGNIYYCASGDLGRTWNKQSSYQGLKEKQMYCMSYSSNFSTEAPRVSGLCVPGSYTQGFSLAFYKDDRLKAALNIEEEPACSPSDINKEVTGTDTYNSVENNRPEYCPEACREYARYYDKLFTEIEKLDIRQTLLEAEISSLKKQIAEDKTREAKALNNESISTEKVQSANKADKHSDTGIIPAVDGFEANKQEPDKSAKDKQPDKEKSAERTMSLMVGTGFSFVTPEYLKSLKKQEPGGLK